VKKIIKALMKLGIVCCLFWLKTGESVFAQSSNIVPDNTLDGESSTVLPLDALGLPIDAINGGAVRGINLFHSFREFNVSEGRSAYFFSPSVEIENIVARVTGRNPSEILGTLGTLQLIDGNIFRSNANFFLINPNGIVFGEKASLDLAGSFIATTANAAEFGDGGLFSASQPEVPKLLTINPSAFLLNQIPAPIINQSQVANNINASLTDGLTGL
jgi:filamentous hemagglutinin family protein